MNYGSCSNHRETQQDEQLQSHQVDHEEEEAEHKEEGRGAVRSPKSIWRWFFFIWRWLNFVWRSLTKLYMDNVHRNVLDQGGEPGQGEEGSASANTTQTNDLYHYEQLSVGNSAKHDVFLNHRGPDLKTTFVSHLDAAIRRAGHEPFLDVKSLVKGQHAFRSISEALRGVLVHVVIFSPRYAESKYCLDELCYILESQKPFISVLYDVEPENLRRTKVGPYAQAFRKHLKKGRDKDVVRWKKSLLEAANITGFRRRDYANDTKLVDKIVAVVLDNLPSPSVPSTCYSVGLEELSAQVIYMLHKMKGNHVRVVGICGMGGIGKTTLATHVYNHEQSNFKSSCFLKDVKEAKGNVLKTLQMKMLKDLAHEDAFDSTRWYERIWNRKVLLVIDDISEKKTFDELIPNLNQLGKGSEVLITSRNGDILNSIMRDIPESELFHVPELSYSNSLELFTWCAFRRKNIYTVDASFHDFVKQITIACGGLPLALEVMGGYLAHKKNLPDDEKYWNEAIFALRKKKEIIPHLRITYNSLEDNDCKRMFLDIACFMLGHPAELSLEVWKSNDCYSAPSWSLDQLVQRCLVKVDSDGQLSMHDLLRDMGRGIVLENALQKQERFSHIWDPKIATKVLQQKQDLNKDLIALSIDGVDPHIACKAERYARLTQLKYLFLDGYRVEGDFSKWPKELIWLKWRFFPYTELPESLKLQNLAVLDLAKSQNLLHIWNRGIKTKLFCKELRVLILNDCRNLKELPQDICKLVNLKYLNLSWCRYLESLPDTFSELSSLETLNLEGCYHIEHVPPSLCAGLKKLKVLNMCRVFIEALPVNFGQLQNLREVSFKYNTYLRKLPDSFSMLSNLETLNLEQCVQFQELPSVCGLKKLKVLNMRQTSVQLLPHDFGQLQSLRQVDFSSCTRLKKLPHSFSELSNLETLNLSKCKQVQELPPICGLKKLRALNMCKTSLQVLPEDFGQLQSLTTVDFSSCETLMMLPNTFSELSDLEILDLWGCKQLVMFLHSVSGLKKLRVLNMGATSVVQLPEDFGQLQSLREVNFSYCRFLKNLPNSFSDLSNLDTLNLWGCKQIQELPLSLCKLKKLSVLNMRDTSFIQLPEDFGRLQSLIEVDFSSSNNLERLPDSFSKLSNLEMLDLSRCVQLQKLPRSIRGLKKLKVLNMSYTLVEQLPDDFGKLQNLSNVNFTSCGSLKDLPDSFSELSNLEILDFSRCTQLQKLPPTIQGLKKLKVLNMSHSLVEQLPEDFGELQSLREVYFLYCKRLKKLPNSFSKLSNIETLNFLGCIQLQKLPPSATGLKKIKRWNMWDTSVERPLEDSGRLQRLIAIDILCSESVEQLFNSFLGLSNLEKKFLMGKLCEQLQEQPALLCGLKKLTLLGVDGAQVVQLREAFDEQLQNLWEYDFSCCGTLLNRNLEGLYFSRCVQIQSLRGVNFFHFDRSMKLLNLKLECTQLQMLSLSACGGLIYALQVPYMSNALVERQLEDLARFQRLTIVDISYCGSLQEFLDSISQLSSFEKFLRRGKLCKELQNLLPPSCGLKALMLVSMGDTLVVQLCLNFGQLPSLREVYFSSCGSLEGLSNSFLDLLHLGDLDLFKCLQLRTFIPFLNLKKL
ncbi:hypothetical protein M758_12G073700 [Ceratodon purpureus]|nr:hypothetical protein M758_12G073700 [Ceratodon purpureus]